MKTWYGWGAVLLVSGVLAVGGAMSAAGAGPLGGAGGGGPTGPGLPTAVRVTRGNAFQSVQPLPKLNRTLTNGPVVRSLYSALEALPPPPSGSFACPADFGVSYHLVFLEGKRTLATAVAEAGGCRVISFTSSLTGTRTLWSADSTGASFWTLLGTSLGLSGGRLRGADPLAPRPGR